MVSFLTAATRFTGTMLVSDTGNKQDRIPRDLSPPALSTPLSSLVSEHHGTAEGTIPHRIRCRAQTQYQRKGKTHVTVSMATKLVPSSATIGFFQAHPVLLNPYDDDVVLRALADSYLVGGNQGERVKGELAAFGERVIKPDVFALIADAERNPPSLSTHSTFGVPRTTLHTSYGWRELQNMGIAAGMVAIPYATSEEIYCRPSRIHQFLKYHIWSASSAVVTCPSAMTDGAATLLRRHLVGQSLDTQQRAVFQDAYRRLTSFNPQEAWTSGQWMTERSGGSDVRGTETVAVLTGSTSGSDADGMPLGPWRVDGFKWFSSATDSQMTVLLAKTAKGGLSAFFAPMRMKLPDGSIAMNGVSIQRLKPKLGTRALPTAELVLNNMRAWLIGKEGEGVREISAILNITRLHNALSALGFWGRALGIVRAYARVRKVQGGLLKDNPAFVRNLARNCVRYAGQMQLGFFVVRLLDQVEAAQKKNNTGPSTTAHAAIDARPAAALLRLLTPVAKAQCSKEAIYGIQECMESLGGVGYIEDEQDFNIARLFRDCNVLSIWEGTTDVMASDVVRVLKGSAGAASLQAFQQWARSGASSWADSEWQPFQQHHAAALQHLSDMAGLEAADLRVQGRELLELLAWLTASTLLVQTATMRQNEHSRGIARQWLATRPFETARWQTSFQQDHVIAFAEEASSSHKL